MNCNCCGKEINRLNAGYIIKGNIYNAVNRQPLINNNVPETIVTNNNVNRHELHSHIRESLFCKDCLIRILDTKIVDNNISNRNGCCG